MFTKRSIIHMFFVLLVILMMSGSTLARPLEAPQLGTGFTYQGKLTDGSLPANGVYDFKFMLYDDLNEGSQVGDTVSQDDVTVTNGVFTVQLDFKDVFDGTALYLEIGVRPGVSVGPYTLLTPRQPLTATPYALYASKAPWSGLTGVPGGFADGVDNGSAYQNVRVVAKSGGDYTTITAALNSITDASDTNRYLIHVAPGVYSERVTMKEYVDIEGSGELTTRITFTGSPSNTTGTLLGANNAELRFLTVENTGGDTYAIAILNLSVSPRLTHVTASASGGSGSYGVLNNSSSPTMADVTASASGESYNYGVYNFSSSPMMADITASATGGTYNTGVYNYSASATMTDVTASATGGTYSYGVYNSSSSLVMANSTANASGSTFNYGIYNSASSGTYNVGVDNSQISGSTNTIRNDTEFTTLVGASQLSGGAIGGGGTVSCIGVYDEDYTSPGYTTCP